MHHRSRTGRRDEDPVLPARLPCQTKSRGPDVRGAGPKASDALKTRTSLFGLLQRSYRIDGKFLPKCVLPKNEPFVS
jgi:hypothetical protein